MLTILSRGSDWVLLPIFDRTILPFGMPPVGPGNALPPVEMIAQIDARRRFAKHNRGRLKRLGFGTRIIFRSGGALGERHIFRFLNEMCKALICYRVLFDPKARHSLRVYWLFLRIVSIGSHLKRATRNPNRLGVQSHVIGQNSVRVDIFLNFH